MSNLNYIEKLLDGADVAWLPLGEIGTFIRGNGLQKRDFSEDGFPAIHYGEIHTKYALEADNTFTYVSEDFAQKLKKAQKNNLLLATTSEDDKDVAKPLAWLGPQVAISSDMMLFQHEQNVKYLAYFVQTKAFQKQKRKYITGAKVRRVSSGDLAKIHVPIPCPDDSKKSLKIQARIVRILDAFTSLTAELTAELTARKKQYNYYRDQLLTFSDNNVAWKPLGDVVNLKRGKRLVKSQLKEFGKYAVYQNSMKPLGYYHESNVKSDTVFIICGGAAGEVGYSDVDFWAADDVYLYLDADNLLSKFLYHCLLNQQNKILSQVRRASIPRLSKTAIEKLKIPIPYPNNPKTSLIEQTRIVSILDKFDALTNSISEGLPREIELRQKQYEYYRDLLLSFPKPKETTTK